MHNMQMTVGLSTVFSKIIVFMGILIFVLLSSFPFVSTTTYTMSQTKIATGADTPSIAAFKTMPSLEGDTAETWREFFSSFRHHANLGGQMYADVLDLTNMMLVRVPCQDHMTNFYLQSWLLLLGRVSNAHRLRRFSTRWM